MSLVTWPCRKSLASVPVSASLPRSERSTTKVVTDETLALIRPGQPARHLARELVQHALARHPGRERGAHDGHFLGAAEPLQQRQQPFEVIGDRLGHVPFPAQ